MMKCMPVLHLSALRGLSLPCCSVCLPALSLLVNLLLTLLCCSILLCSTYDNPLLQLFVSSLFLAGLISCVFSAWITRNWGRKVGGQVWVSFACRVAPSCWLNLGEVVHICSLLQSASM